MKKLRNKVFFIIFSILTIFISFIIIGGIIKNYYEKKNSIFEILTTIPSNLDRNSNEEFSSNEKLPNQNIRKIYLDFSIYSIVLDENGNFKSIINHTDNEKYDEKNVKKIAENIIKNHTKNLSIGNLYTEKYAYVFTMNNTLILMDNTGVNNSLLRQLIFSIIILIICEIIIFLISYLLTKWIIKPVQESFEKQKVFVEDASHELKTPLSIITASADAYFNDKNDKWVYNMKNESERMIKLVTELLDLASTERKNNLLMLNSNLSETVESCILTFESMFYDKYINLKYDIKPEIYFFYNEDLMIELCSILIDNAIKYCNECGNVYINFYKQNKQIFFVIKNTGMAIDEKDEKKIFERFYKIDKSRNRNNNNYGLGLAIAKNIVLTHKGTIAAHSENGYTTFTVIFNKK